MPSTRNALKKLLAVIGQQIADAETRIIKAANDEERTKLVETIADLHVRQNDLKAALLGEDAAH